MRKIFSIVAFVILVSCSKEKNMLEPEKNETSEKIKISLSAIITNYILEL